MEVELPYTKEQRALFNAAAHDPEIAREHGMSGREAGRLADEANRLKRQGKEKRASLPPGVIDLESVFNPCKGA